MGSCKCFQLLKYFFISIAVVVNVFVSLGVFLLTKLNSENQYVHFLPSLFSPACVENWIKGEYLQTNATQLYLEKIEHLSILY